MKNATVRVCVAAGLVVVVSCLFVSSVSARLPQLPLTGLGWVMAYAGGASPTGALGLMADRTSQPIAITIDGAAIDDISDVATSGGHTLIVRRNGSVWAMGANQRGQLGLGTTGDPIDTLTQVPALVDIVKVAAHGQSSYALDTGGYLWVWGDDSRGQLGIGNPGGATLQTAPVMQPSLFDLRDIDAGDGFAVATAGDGSILAWGANESMQLGIGGPGRNLPAAVPAPQDFFAVDVATGGRTAIARSGTREVTGWGSNASRQLADQGDLILAGTLILATDAIAIAAGDAHVLIALADGSIRTMGSNASGQLGTGNFDSRQGLVAVAGVSGVVDVAAGAAHSIAVTEGGVTYAWGANDRRQLMMPTDAAAVAVASRVRDVPSITRYARAGANATFLLNDPGALAIAHNIEPYPFELTCGQPFDAQFSITGFAVTGGAPNTLVPGVNNLVMRLNVSTAFERTGAVTASIGSVATNGTQITWTVPSLSANTATLNLRLYPSGPEGEFPVFEPLTYVSSEQPTPFVLRSPLAFHRECATATDQTPPVISTVTPSPAVISPPNNQMVPVSIVVAATDNVSTPVCSISGVTANEPIAGDWTITAPLRLNLRAERAGQGNGRIYRIAVACVDDAGNRATGSTTVSVPKGKQHP